MGYLHIENLYKNQTVLMFKELYALEKLHGTSAHIAWTPMDPTEIKTQSHKFDVRPGRLSYVVKDGQEVDYLFTDNANKGQWLPGKLTLFSGGASVNLFEEMLNLRAIAEWCSPVNKAVTIHGELYGGSQQKQAYRYGNKLKFAAFDVKIEEHWLTVPDAHDIASRIGLEFVAYEKIPATVEACDQERDAYSRQAKRNGVDGDQFMEGVVLRPLVEFTDSRGDRVIAKHKRPEERETKTERKVDDPAKLAVLAGAQEIAEEWVTETRLDHVLDKLPQGIGVEKTGEVIKAMLEDVFREAGLEIVDSKEARNAISARARVLFHSRVKKV